MLKKERRGRVEYKVVLLACARSMVKVYLELSDETQENRV
jgi:hypothetical protein